MQEIVCVFLAESTIFHNWGGLGGDHLQPNKLYSLALKASIGEKDINISEQVQDILAVFCCRQGLRC